MLTYQEQFGDLTAGDSTVSVRDSPSRSVTRLLDRKLPTGVTWGEGVGSTRGSERGHGREGEKDRGVSYIV